MASLFMGFDVYGAPRVAPALIAGEVDWRRKSLALGSTNSGSPVRLPRSTVSTPVSKIPPHALLNKMLFCITVPIGSGCGVPAAEFEIPYAPLLATILFSITVLMFGLRSHPQPLLMPSYVFS